MPRQFTRTGLLLIVYCIVEMSCVPYYTAAPTWTSNIYLQAGFQKVISTSTLPANTPKIYLLPFNSAFAFIPSIAYGIKSYSGLDGLHYQYFIVSRVGLTNSGFSLNVTLVNSINLNSVSFSYVAFDQSFPHRLNTFDNVEANYGLATDLSILYTTTPGPGLKYYTNTINYTQQAATTSYTTFNYPNGGDKILLFLSSFQIANSPSIPNFYFWVDTQVPPSQIQIISIDQYLLTVAAVPLMQLYQVGFSMLIFDINDIQNSKKYVAVYLEQSFPTAGGTFTLPQAFVDSFMMGLTSFGCTTNDCGLFFNFDFVYNGTFGGIVISVSHVDPLSPKLCSLNDQNITLFYMKTWSCPAGFPYFNLTTNLCQDLCGDYTYSNSSDYKCYNCYYACVDCMMTNHSQYTCLSCSIAIDHRFMGLNGSCICSDGYYDNGKSTCDSCQSAVLFCNSCSNNVSGAIFQCISCENGYFLNLTQPNINSSTTCDACSIGCLLCTNTLNCSECNVSAGYGFQNTSSTICIQCDILCNCNGLAGPKINNTCGFSSICGNGWLSPLEQCDDGNLISYDGCDSNCKTQQYYSCIRVGFNPDVCYINTALTLSLSQLNVGTSGCNTLSMILTISPLIPAYDNMTWSSFLIEIQNQSLSALTFSNSIFWNTSFQYTNGGILTYNFLYGQSIQDDNFTMLFSLYNVSQVQFVLYQSSLAFLSLTVNITNEKNNRAAVYYDASECAEQQQYQSYYQVISICSYAVLFLSLIPGKIIGLELFGVLQFSYFVLTNINYPNILLTPLTGMKNMFNGYNTQFGTDNNQMLPNRVASVGQNANFMNNCNVMLGVLCVEILLGVFFFVISKIMENLSKKLYVLAQKMLKEFFLTLILFNCFNISYSTGIHFMYAYPSNSDGMSHYIYGTVAAVGSLILMVIVIVSLALTKEDGFGEFKEKFKDGWVEKSYFIVTLAYRISLGVYAALENAYEESTLIIVGISVCFLMYNLINLPFKDAYHNYRANTCHVGLFIIICTAWYYRSMKSTTPIEVVAKIMNPAKLQIAIIFICIIVSIVVLIYDIYKFIKEICIKKQDSANKNVKILQTSVSEINNQDENAENRKNEDIMERISCKSSEFNSIIYVQPELYKQPELSISPEIYNDQQLPEKPYESGKAKTSKL